MYVCACVTYSLPQNATIPILLQVRNGLLSVIGFSVIPSVSSIVRTYSLRSDTEVQPGGNPDVEILLTNNKSMKSENNPGSIPFW